MCDLQTTKTFRKADMLGISTLTSFQVLNVLTSAFARILDHKKAANSSSCGTQFEDLATTTHTKDEFVDFRSQVEFPRDGLPFARHFV